MFAGVVDVGLMRWPVKTLRDPDRAKIRWTPVDTTVAALTRAPRPPDNAFHGRSRIAPEELTVFRVRGVLRRVLYGSDGDIHLVLADPADPSRWMIAEIPQPLFSIGSGLWRILSAERTEVERHLPARGETVEVTGIGFFDYRPVRRGPAITNGLELHPVIGLKFIKEPAVKR